MDESQWCQVCTKTDYIRLRSSAPCHPKPCHPKGGEGGDFGWKEKGCSQGRKGKVTSRGVERGREVRMGALPHEKQVGQHEKEHKILKKAARDG